MKNFANTKRTEVLVAEILNPIACFGEIVERQLFQEVGESFRIEKAGKGVDKNG